MATRRCSRPSERSAIISAELRHARREQYIISTKGTEQPTHNHDARMATANGNHSNTNWMLRIWMLQPATAALTSAKRVFLFNLFFRSAVASQTVLIIIALNTELYEWASASIGQTKLKVEKVGQQSLPTRWKAITDVIERTYTVLETHRLNRY